MKTKAFLTVIPAVLIAGMYAQKPSLSLTFTAEKNGQHVPLTSIKIENLTQGGDTTLLAPAQFWC
jgi:hypothetical protein